LKSGFVLVGNVPSNPSTPVGTPTSTTPQGSIQVLDKFGNLVQTLSVQPLSPPSRVNGPWDMTVAAGRGSSALVFVSNVLSGTVWRYKLAVRPTTFEPIQITSAVLIGSGFPHGIFPPGLVAGPGGLAYNANTGTLFVASQFDNSIYAIYNAGSTSKSHGTGKLLVHDPTHLHGPIGLTLAPNGNLIAANSDAFNVDPAQPSELVEYTHRGAFVAQFSVDPATGGAFGLAISPPGLSISPNTGTLAAVDDNIAALKEYTFPT